MPIKRHRTVWAVWAFLLLYGIALGVQVLPSIVLPLEGATYALMFVVGAYVGMDQFSAFVMTKSLPSGLQYNGNHGKLTRITIAVFLLLVAGIVVQLWNPARTIPINELFVAFGLTASLFAAGAKAKNAVQKEGPPAEGPKES